MGEGVAIQMQVDVGDSLEQLLRLPFVLFGIPDFERIALGTAQLREVTVQHGGHAIYELRSQERIADLDAEVVEHVHGFVGQCEIAANLTLVGLQGLLPRLPLFLKKKG